MRRSLAAPSDEEQAELTAAREAHAGPDGAGLVEDAGDARRQSLRLSEATYNDP